MIQQTIQEVKFQDIIMSKKQRQARKNNKLRNWLQYLNMLDQNKNSNKKIEVIKQMHKMFILREQFWLREVSRVLKQVKQVNQQAFQFCLLSLKDGFYSKVANLIAQKLFEAYNNGKLRKNYVIAKLQLIISQFSHFHKQGSFYFETLLQIYLKQKDIKKIRQTYKRQIQAGFDNYDVTYYKYLKWQQSQAKSQEIDQLSYQHILKKGKKQWQETIIFIQQQIPKIVNCSNDEAWQNDLKIMNNNKKYIKLCIVYLQQMNVKEINQQMYLRLLQLQPLKGQKTWYLRRLAMSQTHVFVEQYLQLTQLSQSMQQQQIQQIFKLSITWQDGYKYQSHYLGYLIRKINKHLFQAQSQQYNNRWGSNVQKFRSQISQLIANQRTGMSVIKQKVIRDELYFKWIEVEAQLVKDVKTVQEIFQSFLGWGKQLDIYIKYAEYMVRLGDLVKAKFIYITTCQTYKYQDAIVKQYLKFLSVYCSLQEITKFKKKVKQTQRLSTNSVKTNLKQHLNLQMLKQLTLMTSNQSKPEKISIGTQNIKKDYQPVNDYNNKASPKASSFINLNRSACQQQQSKSSSITSQSLIQNDILQSSQYQQPLQSSIDKISNQEQHINQHKRSAPQTLQNLQKYEILTKNNTHKKVHVDASIKQNQNGNSKEIKPLVKTQPQKKIYHDQQNTLFCKNIDRKWTQNDIRQNLKYKQNVTQIRLIQKQNGRICYIDYDTEQNAQKQVKQNRSKMKLFLSRPPSKSDDCTLFLSNLPAHISEEQIKGLIPEEYRKQIKDVRTKQKSNKTTAYVQFNSQQLRDLALRKIKEQKIKFQDKTIIAMSCQSDSKIKDKKRRTIFLKNLSFKCKQKDLNKFFNQKGIQKIKQIFIPKDEKTNKLKGYAYIQLQNHQDVDKALSLEKGEIFGRQFSISQSDRGISYSNNNNQKHQHNSRQKYGQKQQKKPLKQQNKKANNFFSNIFS